MPPQSSLPRLVKRLLVLLAALLLTVLFVSSSSQAAEEQPNRPPNFIFVLVDDLGWTDLGCQGSDLYETPHIDQLAREGMRFTNGYAACTVCSPTRAAVMTGKYPARLHVTDWIHGHARPQAKLRIPDWTHYLALEEITLAEALAPAGYVSASIGKWHLGDEGYRPTDQGFDRNIGGYHRGQPPSYFSPYRIPTLVDGPEGEYLTDRESTEAVRFISDNRDRPFLLYLPHYAVHTPIQAKAELVQKYRSLVSPDMAHQNPAYAAMIESVDQSTGRIMATLEELGLAENTVIVFTSDNGGLLGRATSNVPLRAGKGSAYEGGVRVPCIVRWPGKVEAASTCDEPVISVDFFPTLVKMAGAEAEQAGPIDGESLLPLLEQTGGLNRQAIYWHYPHYHPGGATPHGAVRAGDYKLIEFFEDDHVELYNLADDIGERNDLAAAMPDRAQQLRTDLHAWRERVGAQMPTPNPDYDPAK